MVAPFDSIMVLMLNTPQFSLSWANIRLLFTSIIFGSATAFLLHMFTYVSYKCWVILLSLACSADILLHKFWAFLSFSPS